jgi:hypothetical protein
MNTVKIQLKDPWQRYQYRKEVNRKQAEHRVKQVTQATKYL